MMKHALIFLSGFILGAAASFAGLLLLASWQQRDAQTKLPSHFEDSHLARLPFDGEWFVFWGGGEKKQNAHHGFPAQNLALDLVKVVSGGSRSFAGDKRKNESYACWAQPIYSPTDGTIDIATDGIPDNFPGIMNSQMVYGNSVLIRSSKSGVVVLAHLKNGSVVKKRGDSVKAGDLIGLCGNSGNSSEPHLHIHVQSEAGYEMGVALSPVFDSLVLNGKPAKNYSPVKADRVSN